LTFASWTFLGKEEKALQQEQIRDWRYLGLIQKRRRHLSGLTAYATATGLAVKKWMYAKA